MLQLTGKANYNRATILKESFTAGTQSTSYKLIRIKNAGGFLGGFGRVKELDGDAVAFVSIGMHLNLALHRSSEDNIIVDVIDITKEYLQDTISCIRKRSLSKATEDVAAHNDSNSIYQSPSELVGQLFDSLERLAASECDLKEAIFDAVFFRIMVELYHESQILDVIEASDYKNITDCISETISEDLSKKWKVEDIANALNMSKATLQRKLKESGSDFSQTINTCRLDHARKLLMYTDLSVSQIAVKCGFDSHAYFSALFKKKYGIAPREFKSYVITGQTT